MQLKETQNRLNTVLPEAAKLQKALIENMRFRKQLKKPLRPDDIKYVEQNKCAGYTEQLAAKVNALESDAKQLRYDNDEYKRTIEALQSQIQRQQ